MLPAAVAGRETATVMEPWPAIVLLLAGFLLGAAFVWWRLVRPSRTEAAVLREEKQRLALEGTELRTRLEAEERNHREKLEELESRFRTLAGEILDSNSRTFLRLVSERFAAHSSEAEKSLEARKKEIENLLRPMRENMEKFERAVGEIEKAREGAYKALLEQVRMLAEGQQSLRRETLKLVQALRQPKTRGRWGEMQLRRVFELAGMNEHVDFVTETTVPGGEGKLRPDAIVHLPGGKSVVVDAKTPLEAYLDAVEAGDEGARAEHLQRHARQLREHVRKLGSKEYWNALSEAPDFVVMFVPGEAFYAAALEVDPDLFEEALRQKVLITTPATLIALVKAIAYGWQQEKIAENAQQIADLARELHDRIRTFGEHMEKLGRGLRQTVESYNRAVGSLESRVLPAARRFEDLDVTVQGRRIAELRAVEIVPREPRASELGRSGE